MPQGVISVTKFAGLNYAQDRRQFTEPTVLDGQNFMVDAKGPVSAFADEFVSEAVISSANHVTTFDVGTFGEMIFTTGLIMQYNQSAQRYYPVLQFTDSNTDYPWTMAHVGTNYFFAKKGVTLIRLDQNTGKWTFMPSVSSPYAVTQSAGRLIILTATLVQWSALDDGTDLTTSAATGAGAQALAVMGKGDPIALVESVYGFLVWTHTGMAAFEAVDATSPFRYQRMATTELPINSNCVVAHDLGKSIYLTITGFKITDGRQIQDWEPMMSEYFTREVFPAFGETLYADTVPETLFKMWYKPQRKWMAVGMSSIANPYVYTRTLVHYASVNKWGSFDVAHYGLGDLDLATGAYSGLNFGFIDTDGRMHRFIEGARRDISAQTGYTFYWRPNYDPPGQLVNDGTNNKVVVATQGQGGSIDLAQFGSSVVGVFSYAVYASSVRAPSTFTGSYTESVVGADTYTGEDWNLSIFTDEDWNALTGSEDWNSGAYYIQFGSGAVGAQAINLYKWTLVNPTQGSINSWAEVGLFKFVDGQAHDRLSETTGFSVGVNEQLFQDFIDYLTTNDPNEDYNTGTGYEDWGSNFPTSNDFTMKLISSIDGTEVYNNQEWTLSPTTSAANMLYYNQTSVGLFHYLRIEALDINQFFHLKTIDMTAILAGRL